MTRIVEAADIDDLVRTYTDGCSLKKLSDETGIGRGVLLRRFRGLGVKIRGQSEAERLKWSRIKSNRAAVAAQLSAAWTARRGQTDTNAVKRKRSLTRSARALNVGAYERDLMDILTTLGYTIKLQFPIGPYNVDLAHEELAIAIEVINGAGVLHNLSADRCDYILDRDWAMLIWFIRENTTPLILDAAKQCVAFFNCAGRSPAIAGQYGMIDGHGKPCSSRSLKLDHRTRVPGF